ncbi:MAG: hypothetical protein GXO78_12240 [Calditrichaeota bacterium]|nr:hypothetical protein [Calditrichota bacterium]
MVKKYVVSVIAIFVVWSVLDYIIHSLILSPIYAQTAQLWRPMGEMKMGLMYLVTILSAIFFVGIWAFLIPQKDLTNGLKYGLLFGLAFGISMGYGTYSFMPIPYALAIGWFLGTVLELLVAGALLGVLFKADAEPATQG